MTPTLRVPGSKSETHRALLLAALSDQPCRVEGPLLGADCRSTLSCLQALGARARMDGDDVLFAPVGGLTAPQEPLDCGNSGTTLRLLTGQVARLDAESTLTGDASLQTRPNGPLLAALASLGAAVESRGGRAPLRILGPLRAGEVHLGPQVSSQYASSLLLSLSLLPGGDSRLHMAAPVSSRPYLEITRQVAAGFGVRWGETEGGGGLTFEIPGGQRPSAERFAVAGDWSGAAFPLVGAAVSGRPVRLAGLRADSPQGDRAIVDRMARFGLSLRWEGGVLHQEPGPLHAPDGPLDLGDTPDLFPALCALAAVAPGQTVLMGAPSLRHKECDRIAAMVAGLRAMGVSAEERDDGAVIRGGAALRGACIDSHHDHRVYMAFRLLDRLADGAVAVSGAGCEAVSYPRFEEHLAAL